MLWCLRVLWRLGGIGVITIDRRRAVAFLWFHIDILVSGL